MYSVITKPGSRYTAIHLATVYSSDSGAWKAPFCLKEAVEVEPLEVFCKLV